MNDSTLILANRGRVIVPAITLVLLAVMFGPVLWMSLADSMSNPSASALGATAFILCVGFVGLSLFRSPFEMRLDADSLTIRKLMRTRNYDLSSVKSWKIAYPDEVTYKGAEPDNGLFMMRLEDGTRFRAEVTAEQIRELQRRMPEARAS